MKNGNFDYANSGIPARLASELRHASAVETNTLLEKLLQNSR
jgi:hypothetical protein